MYERIQNDQIPVGKMVTLVQDGPNVKKTIFKKMNELIQQDYPESKGLIDPWILYHSHSTQCFWERH